MKPVFALITAAALAALAVFAAGGSPIAGKWDCTSDDGSGQALSWTLEVTDEGGRLSGSLIGPPDRPGEMPLVDPRLQGNLFLFKIHVNANCIVEAKLKIDGNKLAGPFGCSEVKGILRGTKRP